MFGRRLRSAAQDQISGWACASSRPESWLAMTVLENNNLWLSSPDVQIPFDTVVAVGQARLALGDHSALHRLVISPSCSLETLHPGPPRVLASASDSATSRRCRSVPITSASTRLNRAVGARGRPFPWTPVRSARVSFASHIRRQIPFLDCIFGTPSSWHPSKLCSRPLLQRAIVPSREHDEARQLCSDCSARGRPRPEPGPDRRAGSNLRPSGPMTRAGNSAALGSIRSRSAFIQLCYAVLPMCRVPCKESCCSRTDAREK